MSAYRDTGASISILREGTVPMKCLIPLNETIDLQSFCGTYSKVPMYKVRVTSEIVKNECCDIEIALAPEWFNWPINVCIIIGEDFGKAVGLIYNVETVTVVTRSMTRLQNEEKSNKPSNITAEVVAGEPVVSASLRDLSSDRSGVELGNNVVHSRQIGQTDNSVAASELMSVINCGEESIGLSRLFEDERIVDVEDVAVADRPIDSISREQLIALQSDDVTIAKIFDVIKQGVGQCEYSIHDNGLLERKIITDKLNPDLQSNYKIIIPYCLRGKILNMAHSLPASGHMGVRKTIKRIVKHFYWPKIQKDFKNYCLSCKICQRMHKTGKKYKAPMLKTLLVELPFRQVSIDIVGPLCTTSKNNRFILCVVDSATRWAECYPMPGHTSASIAKAMTDYSRKRVLSVRSSIVLQSNVPMVKIVLFLSMKGL